ncbi:MAG: archease [Candidatus Nealsonbacteria bacterium]
MEKYQILEHTADVKVKAFGKDKKELFLNMLKGMASILQPEVKSKQRKVRKIRIKSIGLETLLVDFLSEALYLTQINKEIYNNVKFKSFTDTEIEGELIGQKIERFKEDIKGVTYHEIDIHQGRDGVWEVTVIFDI